MNFRSNALFIVVVVLLVIVFSGAIGTALSFVLPSAPSAEATKPGEFYLADTDPASDTVADLYGDFNPLTVGNSITTPDGFQIFFLLSDNEQKTAIVQITGPSGQVSNPTPLHMNDELKVGESSGIIARQLLDNQNQTVMVIEYWSLR